MDDEVLTIHESWPGTTIDGEPGLVSGVLTVTRAAGGEFLLNLTVGPHGGTPRTRRTSRSRSRGRTSARCCRSPLIPVGHNSEAVT
jgi:hypothetical protein